MSGDVCVPFLMLFLKTLFYDCRETKKKPLKFGNQEIVLFVTAL